MYRGGAPQQPYRHPTRGGITQGVARGAYYPTAPAYPTPGVTPYRGAPPTNYQPYARQPYQGGRGAAAARPQPYRNPQALPQPRVPAAKAVPARSIPPAQHHHHHHHHQHHQQHHPHRQQAAQAPRNPPGQGSEVFDLPFARKELRIVEYITRSRRQFIPDDLLRLVNHWVDLQPGTAPFLANDAKPELNKSDSIPYEAKEEPADGVDVRAIIFAGISPATQQKHVTKRIELVASSKTTEGTGSNHSKHLEAYGGVVERGSEDQLREGLAKLVKEQCGLDVPAGSWTKFAELAYKGGRQVIFYVPDGLKGVVKLMAQDKQEDEEYETEEEVTDNEAEETKEEAKEEEEAKEGGEEKAEEEEKKKKTKKVKVTKTRVKKTPMVQPNKVGLQSLLDYRAHDKLPLPTVELVVASDLMDQFFQREMGTRVKTYLTNHVSRKQALDQELKAKREAAESLKRKRDEEDTERKKARAEEEVELRAKWKAEDEGKTDDEKREAQRQREAALRAKWKEEDTDIARQRAEEVRNEQLKAEAEKKYRVVIEQDTEAFDAFQFFDRPATDAGGAARLARVRLANILQCLNEEMTPKQAAELIDSSSNPGYFVDYRQVCEIRKKVPLEDTTKAEGNEEQKDQEMKDANETPASPEGKEAGDADELTEEAVKDMGFKELQAACKRYKLKASGKKEELVQRLLEVVKG